MAVRGYKKGGEKVIKNKTLRNVFKWIARIVGSLIGLFFLLFMIGEGFSYSAVYPTAYESVLFLFIPIGLVAGIVVAWWKEGLGGLIIIGSVFLFNIAELSLFPDEIYYSFEFWWLLILGALYLICIKPKEKAV